MRHHRPVIFFTVLLIAVTACTAEKGLNVFHMGNSLTDETYSVHPIAEEFGYADIVWARFVILGAPIKLLWEADQDGDPCCFKQHYLPKGNRVWDDENLVDTLPSSSTHYITDALTWMDWDVLILQVYPKNGDSYSSERTRNAVVGFSGKFYEGNPNGQVVILPSHNGEIGALSPAGDLENLYEPLADLVTSTFPDRKPALVVPVHQAWDTMVNDGYSNIWSDNGHANGNGRYLNACLIYSIIYKRDCAGAYAGPVGTIFYHSVDQSYAPKAQQVAWSTVQAYDYAGLNAVNARCDRPGSRSIPGHVHAQSAVYNLHGRRTSLTEQAASATGAYRLRAGGVYIESYGDRVPSRVTVEQ